MGHWNTIFAVTIWWIWKWRNERIFRNVQREVSQKLAWIYQQTASIINAFAKASKPRVHREQTRVSNLKWERPPRGWVKVNTDANVDQNSKHAWCGGVMRDENGVWLRGVECNIGWASVNEAELWGVIDGLELPWKSGRRKVIIEVDSERIAKSLTAANKAYMGKNNLSHKCKSLIKRDWDIKVSRIFREQNKVADGLAKHARACARGSRILDIPPREVVRLLWRDRVGQVTPRVTFDNVA